MKLIHGIKSTEGKVLIGVEAEVRNTFIDTFNQVFPLELEAQYVSLTNLMLTYMETCVRLEQLGDSSYSHALDLQRPYYQLESVSKELKRMQAELQAIMNQVTETQTIELYKRISSIANEISKAIIRHDELQVDIKLINDKRIKSEGRIATEKEDLDKAIVEIKKVLQAIISQNVNGEKRIKRLQIHSNHLKTFDTLEISSDEKAALKRQFVSYFNMRCTAFQYVEELAEKVLAAYSNREVLSADDAKLYGGNLDNEYGIYRIALQILHVYPGNYPLGSVEARNSDSINNDCKLVELITQYLKEGTFDREAYERTINGSGHIDVNVHYICENLMHMSPKQKV